MTDLQIQSFLERLRAYHGATVVRLEMVFEDGNRVVDEVQE